MMKETELLNKKCKPCEGGIPPLNEDEIKFFKKQIDSNWQIIQNKLLRKEFAFVNFKHTINSVNKIAELAESEGHHPVMHVYFGKIIVELWTHAIDGLSENDFIMAAKLDELF